ncbi:MAG: DMT family transporter [Chlamydiia bacterium]|nr:DMT family transporter [Chlamydiia bacterium]
MTYEPPPHRLGFGITICLIAYLFFITASSLVGSFQGRFPTIQIIFIQNLVSLLCIFPFAARNGWAALKTELVTDHLIRDIFGVGSYYLYFLAIRSLNLVDATTLNYTAPFFVPLIWRLWKKEKVGAHVWIAIVIGFAGVLSILRPGATLFQVGFAYGICAGLASGVAFCSLRVLNLKQEPMLRTLFYYFLFGMLVSFPFAAVVWEMPVEREWLQVIGIGVATAIGQVLLTIAYRYGTASYLSPLGYSTVIYAGIIGWIFLDQPMKSHSWVGTALIVIGGIATFVLKKKAHTVKEVLKTPLPHEKPPL